MVHASSYAIFKSWEVFLIKTCKCSLNVKIEIDTLPDIIPDYKLFWLDSRTAFLFKTMSLLCIAYICRIVSSSNMAYWVGNQIFCQKVTVHIVYSVKGESGKCLSSKFGRNQCLYLNKRYISRKSLTSALIWHPESGRGTIMRAWPCHRRQRVKNPFRGHKIQQNILFAASGRDALLMMPRPLSGCQIKAEIKGFLLMYCLFLY